MVIALLFATALATSAVDAYSHANVTGDFDDFRRAEIAIDAALAESSNPDLHLLKAEFELTVHRLANAKRELALLPDTPIVRRVRADVAMQEGRYREARHLLRGDDSWEAIARLADLERSDALYVRAQEELNAKQMRAFAWIELQRGLLCLRKQRYEDALAHYRRGELAQPGWPALEEHIAEVLALLGRREEAIAICKRLPQSYCALDDAAAERLFEHQHALYPEAAIGHFIEYLLTKPALDPRLVPFAEENVRLRPNIETKALLAKAYAKAYGLRRPQSPL